MTREEHLYSMRMQELVGIAEKLGIKINTKAAKSIAIEKILAAEEMNKQNEKELKKEEAEQVKSAVETPVAAIEAPEEPKVIETAPKAVKAPKKANLKLTELTYKGETKSIKEWAAQINMPWPTLYDRVNRNGWSVDDAIETPLGQRRPKK